MSAPPQTGDLLIAFSYEEEASTGNPNTQYTDPPPGWASLGSQQETKTNIGGAACWRLAPDNQPQSVAWSWTLVGGQDPTNSKAIVFGVR